MSPEPTPDTTPDTPSAATPDTTPDTTPDAPPAPTVSQTPPTVSPNDLTAAPAGESVSGVLAAGEDATHIADPTTDHQSAIGNHHSEIGYFWP